MQLVNIVAFTRPVFPEFMMQEHGQMETKINRKIVLKFRAEREDLQL